MKSPLPWLLAAVAGLAVLWGVFLGAMATYDVLADDSMFDHMWDMMDGMDGMMGRSDGPQTAGSASGRGEVVIEDYDFAPDALTVTAGTVVTWTNRDSVTHTATAEDGEFDTGRLGKDESASVTFDTPGTYEYYCEPHPWMKARIIVQ